MTTDDIVFVERISDIAARAVGKAMIEGGIDITQIFRRAHVVSDGDKHFEVSVVVRPWTFPEGDA